MKYLKLVILLLALVILAKCMGPRRVDEYTYTSYQSKHINYEIVISMVGSYQLNNHRFYDLAILGRPYTVSVLILDNETKGLLSAQVLSMKLTGQKTGEVYLMQNLPSTKYSFEPRWDTERLGVTHYFENLDISTQQYLLAGEIEICGKSACQIETISTILDYKIEHSYGFTVIDKYSGF